MKKSSLRPRIYEDRKGAVCKFYHDGPVPVNFCGKWVRKRKDKAPVEFSCEGNRKLPAAGEIELASTFYAERKGSCVIGVGSPRKFELFCNGVLCLSTLNEGNLYDAFSPENHPVLIPVKKGNNELLIRIAPGPKGAPFCCKLLEKSALKLPILLYPPVLTHPDTGAVTIIFRTMGNVGAGIEYRPKGSAQWELCWDERAGIIRRHSLHKIFLSGLVPGKEYEYRVVMIDPREPDVRKKSALYSFTAPPDSECGTFSFFYTADPQFEPDVQKKLLKGVLDSCESSSCDFLVLGGDINSRYSNARIERDLIPTLQSCAGNSKPVVMIRGNHELRGPEPDSFVDFWSSEKNETYFFFRFGDTAFLVLDAWENRPADHPRSQSYSRHNLDELFLAREKEFVRQVVSSPRWQSARRRIVLAHGASFSHHDNAATMYRWLQEMTDEFFCGANPVSQLHLWLAGHTHVYTRSIPQSAVRSSFAEPPAPAKSGEEYIFPVLTCCGPNRKGLPQLSGFRVDGASDGTLTVRSYLPDGTLFEKIKIHEDNSIEEEISLPRF